MGDESILEYNGGAVIGMIGKNCVAIASDLRFGIRAQTVAMNTPKMYKVTDKCFIGLTGLLSDCQTLAQKIKFRTNLYKLREERDIKASTLNHLVSQLLYEKRFGPYFVEPLVIGLEGPNNKPFLASQDLIGAIQFSRDFAIIGPSATEAMYGMCESLYKPDQEADDLFEIISQCLLSAVDRDALSGWGAVVYMITPDKITCKNLKGRQD